MISSGVGAFREAPPKPGGPWDAESAPERREVDCQQEKRCFMQRIDPKIKFVTLLFFFVLLSGCIGNINRAMASWVGHHQSELIAAWGPPTQISIDGKGGSILIYRGYVDLGQSQGRGSVDAFGNITYTPPQQQGYGRTRMFYVDPNGYIYAWRWQGL